MRPEFLKFARRPDARLDPAEGALLIAVEEQPGLDPAATRTALDAMAAQAPGTLDRFNDFFFHTLGFRGNTADYYDPSNSHLNFVLEHRIGIPITLSIVYCHLAGRAGLQAKGVGFPGRYLVRCERRLVDCFEGRIIERRECQALLDRFYGGRVKVTDDLLRPSGNRDTLVRVLTNLKGIYLGRADADSALRIVELAETLQPGLPENARDRGVALLQRQEYGRALEALGDYLKLSPRAADADDVRAHIAATRKLLVSLN